MILMAGGEAANCIRPEARIKPDLRMLWELLLLFACMSAGSFLLSKYKLLFVLLPIAYLLLERRLRKRPRAENILRLGATAGVWPPTGL